MADFMPEELEAFLSKTDFDFSKVSDWEEFLAERAVGGTGRDADGIQLRDIKNYAVGTATVITRGETVTAQFNVRTLGSGLALPPGVLYVYHSNANRQKQVSSFYVGPPGSSATYRLEVGNGGRAGEESWGALYYIVIKSGNLPGQGLAEMIGKRSLRKAIKGTSWLMRRGFRLLSMGEAGYDVTVQIGNGPITRDYMMQEIISDELYDKLKKTASNAWDAIAK